MAWAVGRPPEFCHGRCHLHPREAKPPPYLQGSRPASNWLRVLSNLSGAWQSTNRQLLKTRHWWSQMFSSAFDSELRGHEELPTRTTLHPGFFCSVGNSETGPAVLGHFAHRSGSREAAVSGSPWGTGVLFLAWLTALCVACLYPEPGVSFPGAFHPISEGLSWPHSEMATSLVSRLQGVGCPDAATRASGVRWPWLYHKSACKLCSVP